MTRSFTLVYLAVLLFFPISSSLAQYSGPAVETCRAYAEREIRKENAQVREIVLDRDGALNIERYTRKAGSQFVSSVLFGNGALVYAQGAAVEMSFLCLLADDKRAVFFYWTPRRDASALAQCSRGATGPGACLQHLLETAELDLTRIAAQRFHETRDNEQAAGAFRKADAAWRAYRDAECARRGQGDVQAACIVELTRRRALDLR